VVASFDRVDLEHPLFEGMFDRRARNQDQPVESPDLYYTMNYTPSSGNEQTLIGLSNQFPFLQEIRHGRGAALLTVVAPDPQWSDLPVRGLFVPLLYRSMYYLSASESVAGEQLIVGEPGELRLAGASGADPLELVAPDGERFTPEQRTLFGAALLQTDASIRAPGIYDVVRGETLVRRVAFNLDNRESDLNADEADAAAERIEEEMETPVQVLDPASAGAEGVRAALIAERSGIEIWNVFLLLALVFLVAEMLVAKQWRPEAVPA
jgi:hypothetical protein